MISGFFLRHNADLCTIYFTEIGSEGCSTLLPSFCFAEPGKVSKKDAGSLCSPSYRSASSKGMEEESAVSSRYSVELSLSNPRSGTSSISESKSVGARELFPLRTINLKATSHKDATKVSRNVHRLKAAEQVFCFGYFFIAK